jgi:predicted  nucleic acid-binding Zn-ribbon protein
MSENFFTAFRHCGELVDNLEKTVTHVSPQVFEDIETDMEAMRDDYEALQNELVDKNRRIAELEAALRDALDTAQNYQMHAEPTQQSKFKHIANICVKAMLAKADGNE